MALNLWDPDGSAKDIDPDLQIEPSPPLERGASLTLHSLQYRRTNAEAVSWWYENGKVRLPQCPLSTVLVYRFIHTRQDDIYRSPYSAFAASLWSHTN